MDFQESISKIRTFLSFKVFTSLIFFILAIFLFTILYSDAKPETYDIELFSVAEKTIRSPKTVEDEEKTIEERKKAADEVENIYVFKKETGQNRTLLLTSIFDFLNEVNEQAALNEEEAEGAGSPHMTSSDKITLLKSKLTADVTEDVTEKIPDSIFISLIEADPDDLEKAKTVLIEHVGAIMDEKIREEQVDTMRDQVAERIQHAGLPGKLEKAAIELGRYAVVANELVDPVLTEERKQQAMEEVEPVKILQGQIVVQEGHLIDRDIYRQLEILNLLKSTPSSKPFIGLTIFVLLAVGALYVTYSTSKQQEEKRQNNLLLTSIIFIGAIILMKIISLMKEIDKYDVAYIFPAAMVAMLIRIMVNERLALIMTAILAGCGSIVFHDDIFGSINVEMALYILFSGLAGVIFLSERSERNNILRTGILVSIVNVLFIYFVLFIGGGQFTKTEYIYYGVYGIVSGLLSAVLTMGILPFFEAGFGIVSSMRLIELSSPNHPLLKKILTEAPGTYHHSVMVANLAEAASDAIGANGLLARVGSYYHDIGKTRRPHFFIENQMNIENPHNQLKPETSKDIIIAHAADGAALLRKHKFPAEIIDIAEQHHGTSLLKYFYHKAKEENPDVNEADFRYPGPKPQTKESAVISLADSVEAAVRSLSHPTREEIKSLVHHIVQDRLLDGQLNESDLTLKELEVIKNSFCESLNGIFHSRIEYPDNKVKKVKELGN